MIVDDSAVIRGMIATWLDEDPKVSVVGTARNGKVALDTLARVGAEVVVLDIEMPEMDGLTALPKLLQADPDLKVIMASTLTARNADISLKALANGAADYIPKPSSTRDLQAANDFRRELTEKVKALGGVRRQKTGSVPAAAADRKAAPAAVKAKPAGFSSKEIVLRSPSNLVPQVLAIGSSTGGPQALFTLFGTLKDRVKLPIVITQHMPPTFTTILAEHLHRISGAPCSEATDGTVLQNGSIYVAPGDYHMTVVKRDGQTAVSLNQDPPVNFCRPAVDPMLESLCQVFGGHVLTLILTGMGHDGLSGGKAVVEAGGTVIAQDENSSVVWGMPGAVATNNVCSAVLPLEAIGSKVLELIGGGGR
jgi:two-component system chemotaxis response regulator CheB